MRSITCRVVHEIDDFDVSSFVSVASHFGHDFYGYVVTPNVDHLIRYHEDASFRKLYESASFVLLDSRFVSHLFRIFKGMRLPVCTGSDLSAALLADVANSSDRVIFVGGSAEQAGYLAGTYQLTNVRHFNPPMGFIADPASVEECLRFIEAESPFRFCFLALGSPQQERIANALRQRGVARGLALCVGASLNFLSGAEIRAPRWLQSLGLEWAFRLLQNPRRMASRYLLRGPRILLHIRCARIVLRRVPGTVRSRG